MLRAAKITSGALGMLVALCSLPCRAGELQEDPPLYEDLLLKEMDQDRKKPKPDFPFDDLDIEDDVPFGEQGTHLDLSKPVVAEWQAFLDDTPTLSVGSPNRGKLRNGRKLAKEGVGYVRKNDKAAFGTNETVAIMIWLAARMQALYPGTVPLVVGDISAKGGRKLRPHASHQSGRDVDLGYYFKDNQYLRRFKNVSRDTMDSEKTWTLIELMLSTHKVQYLFIDRRLHKPLYHEALSRGWSEEELNELFEAPMGNRHRHGVIRHQKGHVHHLHVRFYCPADDEDCK